MNYYIIIQRNLVVVAEYEEHDLVDELDLHHVGDGLALGVEETGADTGGHVGRVHLGVFAGGHHPVQMTHDDLHGREVLVRQLVQDRVDLVQLLRLRQFAPTRPRVFCQIYNFKSHGQRCDSESDSDNSALISDSDS